MDDVDREHADKCREIGKNLAEAAVYFGKNSSDNIVNEIHDVMNTITDRLPHHLLVAFNEGRKQGATE